tara:strand:+ start:175 stop:432 length:258 start_codon:yes stop_codon:yes gene_type:complete
MSARQWEAKMLPGVWKDSVNVELEKHGRQGWELVAVLPGKEDRRELYFKRPLIKRERPEEPQEAPKFKFAEDLKNAFREGLEDDD